jgi:hypothetical protein
MDFVALLKYAGPDERTHAALDRLEAGSPEELRALVGVMHEHGWDYGHEGPALWRCRGRPDLRDPRLRCRPELPNLGASLHLAEDFFLAFGPDEVEVYHPLPWELFLTNPAVQRGMLDCCTFLGRLFGASDCVITSDFNPVVHAARDGMAFDAALASAGPEDGERTALADLYQEVPVDQVMRVIDHPGRPQRVRTMDWDTGRRPPDGWQRVTTWDSKGFWRLDLGPGLPTTIEPETAAAARPAAPLPDDSWWAASGDPDARLEFLLKEKVVSRRKLLLWACACVRRIWPRVEWEAHRRAVEVAERFAEGVADQGAVERAERGAGAGPRGSPRVNHALRLLAQLASGSRRFPPGDVSEAVVDVVVCGAAVPKARAAERRAHAELLRDVFGPRPLRPVIIEPTWRTAAVARLARSAYDEGRPPTGALDPTLLAVLADALEEGGCNGPNILGHLRGPGPHVRGCFVIDAILQNE